jgi:uncharacterized caspase-like protein
MANWSLDSRAKLGKLSRTLAVACTLAAFSVSAQAPLDIRVALVIGNAAYAGAAALANPVNDAHAMADTLKHLGFTVVELRDGGKAQMVEAIDKVRKSLNGKEGVGMLYYAGHGLQLDWHNYMVPVDVKLTSAADVPMQMVDVNAVIDAFKLAGNRMNILVLDACRDNPFKVSGSAKGLAPLDALPGTFLAYATAPGNVAEDGDQATVDGKPGNGLYTQYLLAELSKPTVKIEDIFKRTRLAVRTASSGRQVPWESTSLEEDFFFQRSANAALSPEETERQFQLQLDQWTRLQTSSQLGDLQKFLADFPSGPFSELAQFRFNRIYKAEMQARAAQAAREAERAKIAAQELAVAQAKALEEANRAAQERAQQQVLAQDQARKAAEMQAQAQAQARAAAEIKALTAARVAAEAHARDEARLAEQARAAEEIRAAAQAKAAAESRLAAEKSAEEARKSAQALALTQAAKPAPLTPVTSSAARAESKQASSLNSTIMPMARPFKMGATSRYTETSWANKTTETKNYRVTGGDEDTVQLNGGKIIWDRMGNVLTNDKGNNDGPRQFYPAEFQVGKRWKTRYVRTSETGQSVWELDVKVVGRERIRVPAGEFNTFLIKVEGSSIGERGGTRRDEWKIWVDPSVSFDIAMEHTQRNAKGQLREIDEWKLEALSELP